jgi:excisionase family DNA binding protein
VTSHQDDDQADGLLSTQQAAKWCRVHPDTVLRWVREGHLPSRKIGGKRYYARADVEVARPAPRLRPSGERAFPVARIPDNWTG